MYVYVVTCSVNGKVYVGKTVSPRVRWTQHKVDSRSKNDPLYRAMRRYGVDAFRFEVVEQCASEEESYAAEQRWIERLGSTQRARGYNQTSGGRGSLRPCAETRARMSAAKKGKPRDPDQVARTAASNTGKKRTPEQVARMRQSDHKYRHITPAMCWEHYAAGASAPEIARRLGVKSYQPIYRLLRLGGYPLRPPGSVGRSALTSDKK